MKNFNRSILKIQFILILTAIIYLIQVNLLSADIFFTNGETKSVVTSYLTTRFSSYRSTKGLFYRMFIPKSIPEGLVTQNIYGIRKTFTPRPTSIKEVKDKYGNLIYECTWNKDIRIVQIDLQFRAKIHSQFTQIDSNAPFPIETDDETKIYLQGTEQAPSNEYSINYIARSISYNLKREIDVIYNIALWVNENIKLINRKDNKNDDLKDDAVSVLQNRAGTKKGVCNLLVSLYRGIGIPARVAYGVSFQKEISYKVDGSRVYIQSPNNERYWVEVFFPDAGWLPIDPNGLYFSLPSYIVKIAVGPDVQYLDKKWSVKTGELKELKEFIYDVKAVNFKIVYTGEKLPTERGLITSCPVPGLVLSENKPDLEIITRDKPQADEEQAPKQKRIRISENPNADDSLYIVATGKKIYAQRFSVNQRVKVTEIKIPAIKFSDQGRIWIEVLSDNNGKPGKKLFRTYSVSSTRVRFMMIENPWIGFPVSKKAKSILEPGHYWFTLRSSGSCIFNWFASEGDVTGNWKDTLFLNTAYKKPKWNNILNLDLNYQILGIKLDNKPEKKPSQESGKK